MENYDTMEENQWYYEHNYGTIPTAMELFTKEKKLSTLPKTFIYYGKNYGKKP